MTLSYRTLQVASVPLLFFLLFCSPLLSMFLFACFLTLLFIDCDISTKLLEIFGTKPESSDLRNCVVWITGASGGIGEKLAYEMSKCGSTVVLSSRNKEQLEKVAEKCRELQCSDCLVLPLDVTNTDQHQSSFQEIVEKFGKVDILVNNAGRTQRGSFLDGNLSVDRELFELDYFSQVALTRVVAKDMVHRGVKGQIVLVTSVAKYGAPFQIGYCAAKAALHGAFEGVRVELNSHDINVLFAVPGPVESAISENAFTNTPGQSAGGGKVIDKRMTAERTARLMSVSLANRSPEVWIFERPVSFFIYLAQYMPTMSKLLSVPVLEKRFKEYQRVFTKSE
ncbi:dehydrogenase/reductase SDR family member 7-like [Symsagittifera roscoffensis]|uniref:dehydrogenase/reductase SDR family member 7-like n=1 Tax=Symsagittifera roscoffensis TaxID=84072 RepID=UPI00307C40DB